MSEYTHPRAMWFMGLTPLNEKLIRQSAGSEYDCQSFSEVSVEALDKLIDLADQEDPLLLWLGGGLWKQLLESPDLLEKLQLLPTVLILEKDSGQTMIEQAMQAPVQQVFLGALTELQVHDALRRAVEAHHIFCEMNRMAREVSLERELLEKKADVCSFLFQFFIQASETDNSCLLASGCADVMRDFCGLSGLHIAWWGKEDTASYVLGINSSNINSLDWFKFMRDEARKHNPNLHDGDCANWDGQSDAPEAGKVLVLPMTIRNSVCGILALHMDDPMPQSRDMAQALDVVRRHLAVALMAGSASENFFKPREHAAPAAFAVVNERSIIKPVAM